DLSSEEIERRVSRHLSELKGVRGVNNHMGSRATQDPRVMQSVLGVVRDRGLFFVDSKTSEETVVTQVARQLGVPYATRTGEFLDDGGDTSRTYEIVLELGREAQRRGSAIGIGHPHSGTARAIARALPELQAMGVRIVPVSELTR
ncbi:MAG: divergent polysaccharide deacetylase family protein, partial [Armatimonadetes bacterium]|nr:divergent polysaccharide deacetylase family protein [Armatimonadota bacterium]